MKKKTKKTKQVVVEPFSATIKILGKFYHSTGSTALEAIENLKPDGKCAGNCVISVSKGDVQREKILPAFQTFRLFSPSRMMREMALKSVGNLFQNL